MEGIIVIVSIIVTILLLNIIFKINIKKAKELENNIQITKEILHMLGNDKVKIEEAKDTKTSLYIAITDKISIADMKNNYARIQTIAHECAHSIQDRRILMFNFIFSNIYIIYFITISILTLTNVVNNVLLQIFILLLLSLIKLNVRNYLETEAMMKSRYIAEQYIDNTKICTEKEKEKLLKEYDKINKMGIPFMIFSLTTSQLIWILIYSITYFI